MTSTDASSQTETFDVVTEKRDLKGDLVVQIVRPRSLIGRYFGYSHWPQRRRLSGLRPLHKMTGRIDGSPPETHTVEIERELIPGFAGHNAPDDVRDKAFQHVNALQNAIIGIGEFEGVIQTAIDTGTIDNETVTLMREEYFQHLIDCVAERMLQSRKDAKTYDKTDFGAI